MILQIRRNKSENAAVKSSSFSARAHGPQIYRVRWFGFIIDGITLCGDVKKPLMNVFYPLSNRV